MVGGGGETLKLRKKGRKINMAVGGRKGGHGTTHIGKKRSQSKSFTRNSKKRKNVMGSGQQIRGEVTCEKKKEGRVRTSPWELLKPRGDGWAGDIRGCVKEKLYATIKRGRKGWGGSDYPFPRKKWTRKTRLVAKIFYECKKPVIFFWGKR